MALQLWQGRQHRRVLLGRCLLPRVPVLEGHCLLYHLARPNRHEALPSGQQDSLLSTLRRWRSRKQVAATA